MRLKTDGFADGVHSWWNRHSFFGTPSFVITKKLKVLKEYIIQWNHREFGNISRQKKELQEALKVLDAKEGEIGTSNGEKCERFDVRSKVEYLLSLEEISWRQN